MGYFAGANILMEYVLSNAAVARSFTEYLCCAFGRNDPNSWRVEVDGLVKGYNMLDFPAVALIAIITLCLCHRLLLYNSYLQFFVARLSTHSPNLLLIFDKKLSTPVCTLSRNSPF